MTQFDLGKSSDNNSFRTNPKLFRIVPKSAFDEKRTNSKKGFEWIRIKFLIQGGIESDWINPRLPS